MRELVFKIANKSGVDMEKHWANYEEEYGEVYGEDTQMTDIMEEMVADGFQKIVSNRKDLGVFLNELHKRDKTLVERLTEFLEKVGKTIKALFEDNTYHAFAEDLSRDLENIKQLRKKFAEVLADTGRMEVGTVKQGADVRFSIREIVGKKTDYGIGVVLDTNIFDGVKTRDWNKVLRDYVYKNMAGREIVMYDDNGNPEPVYFAKKNDRVKKGDTGNEHKVIDKLARYRGDNLRALATVHLDEALAASIENGGNKENSHQWMDEKGWIFRKVYLLDRNENIYEATLNIADGRDRKILYDINNIRKIDIKKGNVGGDVSSAHKGRDSHANNDSKNSVAQGDMKSNKKFSMRKAVEEKKDLIAVHNIKAQDMDRALQIGGFPMPSIAIVKDDAGHSKYGEISAVFGKETIDLRQTRESRLWRGRLDTDGAEGGL